ncbi:MAG: hypothetical protein A2X46_04885 [Lentisphaerae bacterium GWF2_57_35]|nr:MAG: hypothetical protein A2X46_04885 [Lentisphaerae bacterium GWF2_57_35]
MAAGYHFVSGDAMGRARFSLNVWVLMCREMWDCRQLSWRLIVRNLSGQVRQSFLGWVWIALPPVATTIIFALLKKASIVNVPMPSESMPYVLFVLLGTTIWQFFSQATIMATNSIVNAGNLVSKVYFPREVLVVSAAAGVWLNLAIRVAVIGLTCLLLAYKPAPAALLAPLLLVPLFLLGLGLGMLFAPINAMMHDMSRMLEFAFQFGMFLAPTIYPTPKLASCTTSWQTGLYWLHTLNPVTHYMHAVNELVERGSFIPDVGLVAATIISILIFFIGWRFFHLCEPLLAERL